ncbi:MAG: hypothetical protein V4569_17765 [Pseudomonadota bacterium]
MAANETTTALNPADRLEALDNAVHYNMDTLWDAIALIDGALGHQELKEPTGAQRIVRMAAQKLREFDEVISPLI